jgi:antitoxin FitA
LANVVLMTTLTIRNVEPELKERLRVRAARNGRSMEAELRHILREALGSARKDREPSLAEAIRRRFLPLGGADELDSHPPVQVGAPPALDW